MNILLIQPEKLPGLRDTRGSIPLSLLYLAAALRDSGRVPHILDFSAIDVPEGEEPRRAFLGNICKSKIEEIGATLVGINCFTTMHFPLVDELAKLIKRAILKLEFVSAAPIQRILVTIFCCTIKILIM